MTSTHVIESDDNTAVDIGWINIAGHPGVRARETANATTTKITTPQQAKNPRIQFLKLSSTVETVRGIPGLTPPFCPAAPTLLRAILDEPDDTTTTPRARSTSPLRSLAIASHSPSKYESDQSLIFSETDRNRTVHSSSSKMPHAVSIPYSGFQALILCGPGIGLSTFTSVPSEFPKALINIANRPMVWYVLDWCYRMGVVDITLVTPPSAKDPLRAALDQNPYLTSLPSPSPDLLAPKDLEFTTPTAELLRLPEIQKVIKSDFLLLPCDLICDIPGEGFLESYLIRLGSMGGISSPAGSTINISASRGLALADASSGRRGGLSIWYNTANREESVKGEECDFMATTNLDSEHRTELPKPSSIPDGILRKLVWAMPMSELWDQVEEDKGWKIRQSLLRKHGAIKCMTSYRDSHIYLFPYWVKEFARLNEDFESVSEDLVGTWAKAEWRKPSYRARLGVAELFQPKKEISERPGEQAIEDEVDLLSLSSTHVSRRDASSARTEPAFKFASRVRAEPDDESSSPVEENESSLSVTSPPLIPPILSHILPSSSDTPLVRRVDTTPLILSVSLLLAKIPSIEDCSATKSADISPFAHVAKVAGSATIAPRVTISRSDTLIDSNSSVATQCVIKSSAIGSSVSIGTGTRITNCVVMDGATIGDKCVLTGTVIGKKVKIGNGCTLQNCEVQDGNVVAARTEGKGEKYLVGGLEDDLGEDDFNYGSEGNDQSDSGGHDAAAA